MEKKEPLLKGNKVGFFISLFKKNTNMENEFHGRRGSIQLPDYIKYSEDLFNNTVRNHLDLETNMYPLEKVKSKERKDSVYNDIQLMMPLYIEELLFRP